MTENESTGAERREGDEEGREGRRESAPNPTQERIDRDASADRPADTSWEEDAWGETRREDGG